MIFLEQWEQLDGFRIRINSVKDEIVYDTGIRKPKNVRSVRIYTEYENQTVQSLKYNIGQWLLYDQDGHSHTSQMRVQFYGDDYLRKLKEGIIQPIRKVRGWIAFQVPMDADIDYAQFRKDYLSDIVVDFALYLGITYFE